MSKAYMVSHLVQEVSHLTIENNLLISLNAELTRKNDLLTRLAHDLSAELRNTETIEHRKAS